MANAQYQHKEADAAVTQEKTNETVTRENECVPMSANKTRKCTAGGEDSAAVPTGMPVQ